MTNLVFQQNNSGHQDVKFEKSGNLYVLSQNYSGHVKLKFEDVRMSRVI
jgi:hypothetical protein